MTCGSRPASSTSPFALAQKWMGTDEHAGRAALTAFFKKSGGQSIDPAQTPWCAAFVNAVLGASGEKGTDSLAARSFLNFGEATKQPSMGDIVVLRRGSDPTKGHVGFFAGTQRINGIEYVKVLGGNTGNKVAVAKYPVSRVLGYRKAPKSDDIKQAVASNAPAPQGGQPQGNGLMANAPAPQTQAVGAGQQPQSTAQNTQRQAPAPQQVAAAGGEDITTGGAEGQPVAPMTPDQRIFGPIKTLGDAETILRQMGVIQ
jgi:uncharacterized protein (TIGR02594 family)